MTKFEEQLNEYLDYCKNIRRMSPQTIHGRKWISRSLLESVKINSIEEISNQHINDWIAEQTARGCSGRTVNSRLTAVVAMLRYFHDMGIATPNLRMRLLIKQKEMPPRRVYYSKEQIEQVLRYADRLEWLLIRICFDCGLRISELRNLRLQDFNGCRVSFLGKGSKAREAYINEQTRKRLDDWIEREKITDYLWTVDTRSLGRRHICVEEIRYLMRRPFYKAGFKNFYPHALRHSFATDLVNNGAPLEITKEMLGHSNISTTERYVHSFEGHLSEYFKTYKLGLENAA